jgi:hypothetical protein
MRRIDFDRLNTVLLDAVLRRASLDELYSEVSACIELPLICFDTSFRLVAYAFKRPFYYQHWDRIVNQGRADERTILGHKYLAYQEMMYVNGRSLLFDSGTCDGYPQACGPVLVGGRLAAYCGTMIEDVLTEDALRANDLLSEATALLIRETSFSGLDAETVEKLLIKNQLEPGEAAKFTASFPAPYAFIMLSAQGSGVSTLEYIRGILCAPAKRRLGCRDAEKHLYMLQYGIAGDADLDDIRAVAETYGLCCGVSDRFCELSEISERRAQAMLTLTIGCGGEPGRLSTFSESYVRIVECCAAEFYGPEAVRHEGIELLAAEDTAGDGDYINTLRCYLGCFKRHAAVADKLGLHRNTVINRIKRIESLLEVDISGGDSLPELQLGLDMHELAELLREDRHG